MFTARFRLRAVSSVRLTEACLKKLDRGTYMASLLRKLGSERSERSSRRKHSFIS